MRRIGCGYWISAGVAIAVFVTSSVTSAAPIVDQDYDPSLNLEAVINSTYDRAQTFTVGVTGTLDSVDVLIFRNPAYSDALYVDVRPTLGGVPLESDASALAAATVAGASIPASTGFLNVDLSSASLAVTAGDLLAIVLRNDTTTTSTTTSAYGWRGHTVNAGGGNPAQAYAGGAGYYRTTGTWTAITSVPHDLGFRTYVEATVVPVPAAAWMGLSLLTGIGGIGAIRRKLRKT